MVPRYVVDVAQVYPCGLSRQSRWRTAAQKMPHNDVFIAGA
jgi:hypothetical protein